LNESAKVTGYFRIMSVSELYDVGTACPLFHLIPIKNPSLHLQASPGKEQKLTNYFSHILLFLNLSAIISLNETPLNHPFVHNNYTYHPYFGMNMQRLKAQKRLSAKCFFAATALLFVDLFVY
jgi:hypothetical protein